jgi:hypothetical protein
MEDHAVKIVRIVTARPSGGFELEENHLGAIDLCNSWNDSDDWTAPIKCIMLLMDAPGHGIVCPCSAYITNGDTFSIRHPRGLTAEAVIDRLYAKGIDLFFRFVQSCGYVSDQRTSFAVIS